jgi:hypothetical protein
MKYAFIERHRRVWPIPCAVPDAAGERGRLPSTCSTTQGDSAAQALE